MTRALDLNIEKCRKAFEPQNIGVLDRAFFEQLVKGFFRKVKKGVTLFYVERDPASAKCVVKKDRVNPFDYSTDIDRQFFNAVCWEYRTRYGDAQCNNCDIQIAQDLCRMESAMV